MARKKDDDVLDEAQDALRRRAASKETDDIFREVEEEIRRERFEKLWARYGTYIAAVAVAVVVLVGGWKFYEYQQGKRAEEAGARFNAALLALEAKKSEDAEKALQALVESGQGGYRALARMRLAALEQGSGKTDAAVKAYDEVAADSGVDVIIRGLASLRAAMLRIDVADWTEMQNRLTPLKDAKNPWQLSARELLGLAAWKAGKLTEAEQEYQGLIENRQTPQGIKQRAEMMLALLLDGGKSPSGGSKDAGGVTASGAVPEAKPPESNADKGKSSPPPAKGSGPQGGQK